MVFQWLMFHAFTISLGYPSYGSQYAAQSSTSYNSAGDYNFKLILPKKVFSCRGHTNMVHNGKVAITTVYTLTQGLKDGNWW